MENAGIFLSTRNNFTTICYSLWPFGNFVVSWNIFSSFWKIKPRKIWQPCASGQKNRNTVAVNDLSGQKRRPNLPFSFLSIS
jgi:hypothetical protein